MKSKKIELVLRKEKNEVTNGWNLYTTSGVWLDYFCQGTIKELFKPGDEACLILEITAHPAEWVGGTK